MVQRSREITWNVFTLMHIKKSCVSLREENRNHWVMENLHRTTLTPSHCCRSIPAGEHFQTRHDEVNRGRGSHMEKVLSVQHEQASTFVHTWCKLRSSTGRENLHTGLDVSWHSFIVCLCEHVKAGDLRAKQGHSVPLLSLYLDSLFLSPSMCCPFLLSFLLRYESERYTLSLPCNSQPRCCFPMQLCNPPIPSVHRLTVCVACSTSWWWTEGGSAHVQGGESRSVRAQKG